MKISLNAYHKKLCRAFIEQHLAQAKRKPRTAGLKLIDSGWLQASPEKATGIVEKLIARIEQEGIRYGKIEKVESKYTPIERKLIDPKSDDQITKMKQVATVTDILLAESYLRFASKHPTISAQAYDDLKAEELEFGGGADLLTHLDSDKVTDYPPHIRSLAYYMTFKFMEGEDWNRLPYGWKKEYEPK